MNKMDGTKPFRLGITPDFLTQSQRLLDPALAEVLGPLPGIECEVMPDTAGVASPDILDRYDAVIVLDYRFTAESFRGVERLALIARWGVGYDRIDIDAC